MLRRNGFAHSGLSFDLSLICFPPRSTLFYFGCMEFECLAVLLIEIIRECREWDSHSPAPIRPYPIILRGRHG